jgi:antitoxin component YwqK of YwqJK toxin-antitoxin module
MLLLAIILTIASANVECKFDTKQRVNVDTDLTTNYTVCVKPDGDEILNGWWKETYTNGILRTQGKYLDNLKQGLWIWQYEDGIQSKNGPYLDDKEHGHWTWRYRDGSVAQHGDMCRGVNCGRWQGHYPNGSKRYDVWWKNGKLCGKILNYFENGQLAVEGYMLMDKKVGTWTYWDNTGKVIKTTTINQQTTEGCME